MMIGAGNILKKHAADQARKVVSGGETQEQDYEPHITRIEFEPALYQCFENCGSLKLTVQRHGGDAGCTVKVSSNYALVVCCYVMKLKVFNFMIFDANFDTRAHGYI